MTIAAAIPPLSSGECQVWWARMAAARSDLLALLDAGERARWLRFRRDEDRARYLVAHALKRLVLAVHLGAAATELSFTAACRHCGGTDHGKPRLRAAGGGIDFSLSHSGEYVVLAVTRDAAVGVDIERVNTRRDVAALIPAVLSVAEQTVVAALPATERALAVLRYWTRKEALLKATGDGLAVAPAAITVAPPDALPALIAWEAAPAFDGDAHLYDLAPGLGHVASLAVLGRRPAVSERSADDLLAAPSSMS
ncbi:MAG TPA: 4'-phosphopantetheinyl transferase superfamily protein, partial [Stellaceae bacterium]|nr:4'-phosphopantetheinyl transferase superfamily protein [Stellaceae bacterium]